MAHFQGKPNRRTYPQSIETGTVRDGHGYGLTLGSSFGNFNDGAKPFLQWTLRGNEQKYLYLSCSAGCPATTLSLLFSPLAKNNVKVEH